MINYLQIFLIVMLLILLKVLFISNKSFKEIIKRASLLVVITAIIIGVSLSVSIPLDKLISPTGDIALYVLNSEGQHYDLPVEDPNTKNIFDTVMNRPVKYSLHSASSSRSSSDSIRSIMIMSEDKHTRLVVLSDRRLYINSKCYKLLDDSLYTYIEELLIQNGSSLR